MVLYRYRSRGRRLVWLVGVVLVSALFVAATATAYAEQSKSIHIKLDQIGYLPAATKLANAEPWPGLLSGGPNAGRQDDVLNKLPAGLPPAKVYADDQGSYASNEIAINWQASRVFLLAGVLL